MPRQWEAGEGKTNRRVTRKGNPPQRVPLSVSIVDGAVHAEGGPVSRVLCPLPALPTAKAIIIPLGPRLPAASSNLPESFSRAGLKRFPIWSCSGRGFPSLPRRRGNWWALTPPFHPYLARERERRFAFCGTIRGFRPLGVTQRPALRSPDFPPRAESMLPARGDDPARLRPGRRRRLMRFAYSAGCALKCSLQNMSRWQLGHESIWAAFCSSIKFCGGMAMWQPEQMPPETGTITGCSRRSRINS